MSGTQFRWHYFNGHTPEGYSWMVCFFCIRVHDEHGLFIHFVLTSPSGKVRKLIKHSRSCINLLASMKNGKDRYSNSLLSHLYSIFSGSSDDIEEREYKVTDTHIQAWGCELELSNTSARIIIPDILRVEYDLSFRHEVAEDEKNNLGVTDYVSYPNCKTRGTISGRNYEGCGWYDYEASNRGNSMFSTGWTWLSIQLRNSQLCIYNTDKSLVCKRYQDNVCQEYNVSYDVLEESYDVATFLSYPSRIQLRVNHNSYIVETRSTSIISSVAILGSYYEGPVNVYQNGVQVGKGFLEHLPTFQAPDVNARKFFGSFPIYIQQQIRSIYDRHRQLYELQYPGTSILDRDLQCASEPILYTTELSGGCWRSALASLCCSMVTTNENAVDIIRQLQPYIEISQAASLVIDDIQDKSQTRRGEICAYRIYNPEVCYLAAELTSIHYMDVINRLSISGERKFILASKILASIKVLHLGQISDIRSSDNVDLFRAFVQSGDITDIVQRITTVNCMKTSVSAAMVFELGAIVGSWFNTDIDDDTIRIFSQLGMTIGLAYQTLNDLEDIVAKQGDDLRENKFTLPMVLALQGESELTRHYIGEKICNLEKDDNDIAEILIYLRNRDVSSRTRSYISELIKSDWEQFDTVTKPSLAKLQLRVFCDILCKSNS